MEALKFFENNKNDSCFASNHFGESKYAHEFVIKLYRLGAVHIEVDGIYDEPWRIKSEGGPYADIFMIHLPAENKNLKKILLAVGQERPDELTEEKDNIIRLWWD